jgi:hypothetical protein
LPSTTLATVDTFGVPVQWSAAWCVPRAAPSPCPVHGDFPANLCVRISSPILGGVVPKFPRHPMLTGSVVTTADWADAYNCPSRHQGNKCGACRACWSRGVKAVAYHKH